MTEQPSARPMTDMPVNSLPSGIGQIKCSVCETNLSENYFKKHLTTKKHIANMKLKFGN
jgi:hypothetical protein